MSAPSEQLSYASDGQAIQTHEFAYRRSPDQDSASRCATRSSSSAPARWA